MEKPIVALKGALFAELACWYVHIFIGLGIMAIVPIAYSFIYFKKHQVK
ncbi:hypothetical protein [Mucilaginibacter sp.]